MTSDEKPIENLKSRTERFADWLVARQQRRSEQEPNLESLVKWNVLISFLTLCMVGGIDVARGAIVLIPYI